MESKRHRHPNVRLGDVGEIPAAMSCGIIQRSQVSLESKRRRLGNKERKVYLQPACGFSSQWSEFTYPDSTETQKWETSSPSSVKEAMQGIYSDDASASQHRLAFGALAPMVRVMKRGRSLRCSSVMGSSWHSVVSPGVGNAKGKVYRGDAFDESISNVHADLCGIGNGNGKDYRDVAFEEATSNIHAGECSDHEVSNMSKVSHQDYFVDHSRPSNWKEISADEGYCTTFDSQMVHAGAGGTVVKDSIRGWLEDLGLGKYAHVFEMHEVDGEVLPLLTVEDLKEMGVNTVGSRRKMFNAIQLLNDGASA